MADLIIIAREEVLFGTVELPKKKKKKNRLSHTDSNEKQTTEQRIGRQTGVFVCLLCGCALFEIVVHGSMKSFSINQRKNFSPSEIKINSARN